MRVVAAMSGGVDSAVAAARAVVAGHDVVGVHLALSREQALEPESGRGTRGKGCCTIADAHDARRSADILGIPFYIWDLSTEFAEDVLDDFVAEYAAGRTPNPCMRCNEKIKFAAVLDRAIDLGFDALCTGHYARIVEGPGGHRELHRAVDPKKDQSYVLGVLTAGQIAHSMFPLGDSLKTEVRAEAQARGLLVADKPDSHDICFIPDGDTAGWLRDRLGEQPGQIVDAGSGSVLGSHDGAFAYTVGQRKGLGVTVATNDGSPRFVVDVDPVRRVVSVGPPTMLDVSVITSISPRFTDRPVVLGARYLVQIRAHGEQVLGKVKAIDIGKSFTVELEQPLRGVAKGQTLVLYEGSMVVGSGTIASTARSTDGVRESEGAASQLPRR